MQWVVTTDLFGQKSLVTYHGDVTNNLVSLLSKYNRLIFPMISHDTITRTR